MKFVVSAHGTNIANYFLRYHTMQSCGSWALDIYATEKARLKTKGKMVDDFDLLIGATAIHNNLTLVTKNLSDFDRLEGIIIEDWTTD